MLEGEARIQKVSDDPLYISVCSFEALYVHAILPDEHLQIPSLVPNIRIQCIYRIMRDRFFWMVPSGTYDHKILVRVLNRIKCCLGTNIIFIDGFFSNASAIAHSHWISEASMFNFFSSAKFLAKVVFTLNLLQDHFCFIKTSCSLLMPHQGSLLLLRTKWYIRLHWSLKKCRN